MAQLYTINHNYPNTYFAFHLTPDDMSMAAEEHAHQISSINELSSMLSDKAPSGHMHEMATQIRAAGGNTTEGPHNVQLTASGLEISSTNGVVTMNYGSVGTGNVMWINNDASAHTEIVQFTTDTSLSAGICPFGEVGLIRFKENHNA